MLVVVLVYIVVAASASHSHKSLESIIIYFNLPISRYDKI